MSDPVHLPQSPPDRYPPVTKSDKSDSHKKTTLDPKEVPASGFVKARAAEIAALGPIRALASTGRLAQTAPKQPPQPVSTKPLFQTAPKSLKGRSQILPTNDKSRSYFVLVTRSFTWIQGSTRNALSLLDTGLQGSTGLIGGTLGGSFLSLTTSTFLTGAYFYDGVVLLTKKDRWGAAKNFFASSGSASSVIVSLNAALTAIKQVAHVAGPFLISSAGMIAGAALAGLGPLVSAVLDGVKLSDQEKQFKAFKEIITQCEKISKQIDSPEAGQMDLDQLEKELHNLIDKYPDKKASKALENAIEDSIDLNAVRNLNQEIMNQAQSRMKEINHQELVTMAKIVGAVAIGALQIIVAIGTGGISVGVMAAIVGGYLLAAYLSDIRSAKKREKNLETFLTQLKTA